MLVPPQRHVTFENEFEDKIDYDEWSELPCFDRMFDLSMLDDWEDNLVDIIAWVKRLADFRQQKVKKEDKNVHVGGVQTSNQAVQIKDCVVTVNYYNYSVISLLKENVVFAGKRVLTLWITECI